MNPLVFEPLKESQEGKAFYRASLEEGIQKVYGVSEFERISYRFEAQHEGGDLLIVDALEKAWGPGYLSFGLGLANDFKGDYLFGIRGTYTQTWVNRLGAEWTTAATLGNAPSLFPEFYQPRLDLDRLAFVAPYLSYDLSPESVFFEEQRVARYDDKLEVFQDFTREPRQVATALDAMARGTERDGDERA